MPMIDRVDFFFDPICPWAWRTSVFVREVASRRELHVCWRFFSLRVLNERRDYAEFPSGYRARHEFGLRILRVAACLREELGDDAVGRLYLACGTELHERGRSAELVASGDVGPILRTAGALEYSAAADDERMDDVIRSETALAITRVGPDLGTPVITFGSPNGPSLFGPVLSVVPDVPEIECGVGLARHPRTHPRVQRAQASPVAVVVLCRPRAAQARRGGWYPAVGRLQPGSERTVRGAAPSPAPPQRRRERAHLTGWVVSRRRGLRCRGGGFRARCLRR